MEAMTFSQFITAYNTLIKEDNSLYHALAKRFGLSDTAFWILYILEESDHPVTQAELCAISCLTKQTVNSALKGLSDSGYIRLEAAHGKGRGKRLALTPSGRVLIARTIHPVFRMEERAYEGLTPLERQTLLDLNRRYLELLRQAARPLLSQTSQEESVSYANQAL